MPKPPKWSYGITTYHKRQANILQETVASLARAGFDQPHIFLDGMEAGWKAPSDNLASVTIRQPAGGQYKNWLLGLIEVYYADPEADYFAMFEDDLLAPVGLREYLERTYPQYLETGYLNLITHPENVFLTQGVEGWHLTNQRGRGGVGLVFSKHVVRQLLSTDLVLAGSSGVGVCGDGMVINKLSKLGIKEYCHFPTLLQHTGDESTLGSNCLDKATGKVVWVPHSYGKMCGWRGEDWNPLTLLGEDTKKHMTTRERAISSMVSPNTPRPNAWKFGIIQIHVTRACDKKCFGCTQGSNLRGNPAMISLDDFDLACQSLKGYWGVIGIFGGNPAVHPKFKELCQIALSHFPQEQLGLWCNHPMGKGAIMRHTFNAAYSNLNVHLDQAAFDEFRRDWPEARPFGLHEDSRHSPPFIALQDVVKDEEERWKMIQDCDINKNWSAMVASIPGKGLRGFFCEIAGAQAILHADDPDWPDTGIPAESNWWQKPIEDYAQQIDWHCHRCGIPLRRHGQLAINGEREETSLTHLPIYKPKDKDRVVDCLDSVDDRQGGVVTDYIGNAAVK